MYSYIVRRLLLMVPTLFGITVVVFASIAAAPGGISAQSLIEGQNLDPQAKKALEDYYNRRYGLDQPAPIQYLRWLNNLSPAGVTFDADNHVEGFSFTKGSDLGTSFLYGRPVTDLLAERVPITLLLNVISFPIIYILAISIGVRAATERGRPFDVGSNITVLALWSVPTILIGVLLIAFFASAQYWHWFPAAGLSRREALEMPFMPHWQHSSDALLFLALGAGGALALLTLSRRAARVVRSGVMAGLGVLLGVAMAAQAPGSGFSLLYLFLPAVLGSLFGATGYMEYQGLRSALLSLIGLGLGVGLAAHFAQGEFVRGFLLDRAWHLVLPVVCLAVAGFAVLSKLTRTAVLENLLADYARTARAKGVSESHVLWRHVFRNSLLPLITAAATLLPALLGGSVIVESIFSIEGMGKLAVEALKGRDRELTLSITFISGVLTLFGYLIADICYAIADPRVSYE